MTEPSTTRRDFLGDVYTAMAGIGLSALLAREGLAATTWEPGRGLTHHAAKAKRILQIFCPGAASHIDLWENKPELEKRHGSPLPGEENLVSFQGKNGNLMRSPWPFAAVGESGKKISTLLPNMARHVDDIAFLHGMWSKTNTHGPGCVFMNTGRPTEGFPAAGAWLSYALGSENDNLPTYVAITDVRGEPPNGKANWSNGFLPARLQRVMINTQQPLRNLNRPAGVSSPGGSADNSGHTIDALNRRHGARLHPGDTELQSPDGRSTELAARMQLSAPEATDLAGESPIVRRLYGTDDPNPLKAAYARNCLLARRFLERGVRYVNLYCASRASGVDGLLNWDAHKTLKADYERHCPIFDQPTAALLSDLKARGLLEDTLVLWTTEFGRMPTHQQGTTGRDHNPDGFTCWLLRGSAGEDQLRRLTTSAAAPRSIPRASGTSTRRCSISLGSILKLLTWYHDGAQRRLTDVHGRVIHEVLA